MSAGRATVAIVLSATLAVLAFPPVSLFPVAFVSLAPLFLAMRDACVRRAILLSFLFSAIFFGAGLFWVRTVSAPGLVLLVAILSGYVVLLSLGLRLAARSAWVPYWIAAPVLFTAVEYLRSILFTGFPWLLLGHTQIPFIALAQIADLVGVPGVTFLVALVASTSAHVMRERTSASLGPLALATSLVALSVGYGFYRLRTIALTPGPVLTAVQANISQDVKHGANTQERIWSAHRQLSDRAVEKRPETDLLVWSETMFPWPLDENSPRYAHTRELLANQARRWKVSLLVGLLWVEKGDPDPRSFSHRERNSAVLFSPSGELVGRCDKVHLVPMGEYIPFRSLIPWRERFEAYVERIGGFLPNLTAGEDLTVLPLATDRGDFRFGTLICYDAIFPELAREIARRGANFIVNLSNEGWYLDSAELEQFLAISAFRAIENRLAVFRATNTGISAAIDPLGRLASVLTVDGRRRQVAGTLTADLAVTSQRTLYTRVGDALAQAFLVLGALATVDGWRRLRRR